MKLKNSNCDEIKKTQLVSRFKKLKFGFNLKAQIVMKLKNSNGRKIEKLRR